jgi:hypothetical protein
MLVRVSELRRRAQELKHGKFNTLWGKEKKSIYYIWNKPPTINKVMTKCNVEYILYK